MLEVLERGFKNIYFDVTYKLVPCVQATRSLISVLKGYAGDADYRLVVVRQTCCFVCLGL